MITDHIRAIIGFPGYYVTSGGAVLSRRRSGSLHRNWPLRRLRTMCVNGYLRVTMLREDGTISRRLVHRIVAETFLGRQPSAMHEVDHIDGDRTNNSVDNLRWVTHSQNVRAADARNGGRTKR